MADGIAAQASIQRRLLPLLIVVMLIVVACAAAVSYLLALSVAQSAYDRSLPDPAFDRRQLLPRQFLRLGCEIVHPNHGVEPQ